MPQDAHRAVLLLHMMPAARDSFFSLTQDLNKQGMATLAIDLRGHGESVRQLSGSSLNREAMDYGIALDYKTFDDLGHQKSRLDVDAAVNFIKKNGFTEKQIYVVGASIGANLALDTLDRYVELRKAVLLSPGLDYRGIKADHSLKGLEPGQSVWIVTSKLDEYATESSQKLFQQDMTKVKLTVVDGSDHGTNMFISHGELQEQIAGYLKE